MKFIKLVILLSSVMLTACAGPFIKDENNGKPVGAYVVNFTSSEKIYDKKINLNFKLAENANIGEFDWKDVQEDIVENLTSKGVVLSDDGRPVTVVLNGFKAWGSNYYKHRSGYANNGIASGISDALGVGIVGRAVSGVAEGAITADAQNEEREKLGRDSGDGTNFVPEVDFTIESDNGFKSNVNLIARGAFVNYLSTTEGVTVDAVSEFFEPK